LSLGIETLGGVMTKLVEKNTTIPAERKQVFSTADDNQTAVTVSVYQGDREIARNNRLLGQFNLEGIPPAPRGMPQIEVKFDIDANGILNVSAKDLGTGKEQTVRIEQSSGLSETEIDRMRKDAEEHAAEDKAQRELIDLRNKGESMCWQLEKLMKEQGDKLQASDKAPLEAAIAKVREAAKADDAATIRSAVDDLEAASHAFSATLYKAGSADAGAAAAAAASGEGPSAETGADGSAGDDDTIDAEFEVKK